MWWLTWGESNEEKPSKAVKSRQKPTKSRQKPSDGFWRKATAFDDCTPGGRFFQFLIWPIMTNFVVKNFVIYINITNMDREDPESRIRYLASLSCLSGYVASSSTTCRVKKWYMKYEIWQWDWWTFPPNHPSPKTMNVSLQNLTIYCLRSLYSNRDAVWRSDGNVVSGFSHSGRCSHAHLTRRWEEGNQRV